MAEDTIVENMNANEELREETSALEPNAGEESTETAVGRDDPGATSETPEPVIYTLTQEEFDTVQAHIQKLQSEKDELTDLLQRNQAEFDNYRRRNAQIRLDSLEDGKRDCITALLPVLDDFDRVMASGEGVDSAWFTGIQMVQKKMWESLQKAGLALVPEEGSFDPAVHMAVQTQKAEGIPSGQVVATLQKGYTAGGRVVRPGMVVVSE